MQPLEVAVKLDETFDLSACTNQRFLNRGKRNPKKKKKQQKKIWVFCYDKSYL